MEYVRDMAREKLFRDAYKLSPEIHIKYVIKPDNLFDTFTLKFINGDKEWVLEEKYDNNNKTDHCTLTGTDTPFKRFCDAEYKLVDLIKETR